jgi:hypothetical protein
MERGDWIAFDRIAHWELHDLEFRLGGDGRDAQPRGSPKAFSPWTND